MANHGYFAGQIFAGRCRLPPRIGGRFGTAINKGPANCRAFVSLFPRTAVADSGRLFLDD
jgi:hypothetical protein